MTNPNIQEAAPSKLKTYLATASSVLALLVTVLTFVADVLPEKWAALAYTVIAVANPIITYLAKYKKPGQVLVEESQVIAASPSGPPVGGTSTWDGTNPYES